MGVTDTQSYSLVIRNMFFDAVSRLTFFANYTKRKTKMLQVQPELLPYLGVYIIDEIMTPDGDANTGDIRFSHALRIGFSVMVANNDQDVAEQTIDAAFWQIMKGLWTDQYLMSVWDTYNPHTGMENPDNTRIESIVKGTRRHLFGHQTLVNETPLAELQYDVTAFYRSEWFPEITDTLDEIDVSTGIKPGDSQDEMDKRWQVRAKYVFPPTTKEGNGHG
jgi:hypothetical protein